jgi:hypothetical protein
MDGWVLGGFECGLEDNGCHGLMRRDVASSLCDAVSMVGRRVYLIPEER